MTPLTPADVKRWDPEAIHGVFQTATNRASSLQTLGDNLQQVHLNLSEWHGDSGDAFRADLGKTRHDIEADGHESRQVAAAVSRAEADVRAVKSELDGIEQSAHECGFTIASDWRIDPGGAKLENAKLLAQQQLQAVLDVCKLHAHSADQELAAAIRSAVGETPVGVTPSPLGAGQPKTLQDMLLPAGPARPQTGGDPAKGPPIPGEAHGGATPSLQDMLLGRGEPAGAGGPSGDPLELLSRIPPGTRGVAPPPLKPAEIESFKAMARRTMINDGVPPDQIEARLDAVVGQTQQWLDAGAPNYVAPEGPRPPAPGFGEGFGDRWFAMENAIHDLTGQNGGGAMGDAWGGMVKGLASDAKDSLLYGPFAHVDDLSHEVKSFMDNPAYYAGGKTADGAIALPGLMFGPETLGLRAGLGDMSELDAASGLFHGAPGVHPATTSLEDVLPGVRAPEVPHDAPLPSGGHPSGLVEGPSSAGHGLPGPSEPLAGGGPSYGPVDHSPTSGAEHGPAPEPQWAQIGHDQPITYHPEASQVALDLADAAAHGRPTSELSQRIADMSTHYVGDDADRVVLGKWAGDENGYIGEARRNGGIYYDTSGDVWDNIGHGLSKQAAIDLGWEVNENFLRSQMERGVARIDYVTEGTRFNSIADVLRLDADSFSAKEIRYLIENAGDYGYERVGDSWVRVEGRQ